MGEHEQDLDREHDNEHEQEHEHEAGTEMSAALGRNHCHEAPRGRDGRGG
jgi:hypothetical protein